MVVLVSSSSLSSLTPHSFILIISIRYALKRTGMERKKGYVEGGPLSFTPVCKPGNPVLGEFNDFYSGYRGGKEFLF